MIETIIKYSFIISSSLYIFRKLLNISIPLKTIVLNLVFTIFSIFPISFIRYRLPMTTLLFISLLMFLFSYLNYKKNISITISYTIISLGISFFFYSLSSFVLIPIAYMIFPYFNEHKYFDSFVLFIIGIIEIILITVLFRIKRFRSGLPKLENFISSDIGVLISIFLLFMVSLLYTENGSLTLFTVLIFIIILSGVILILWWRSLITNSYLERLHKRDTERYEKTIEAQQQEIDNLKLHNDELARIIHKDNKLIPAMELAVKDFLRTASDSNEDLESKASSLINQLESLSSERKGIIHKYETTNKTLPKTSVASTDAVMKYLLHRANESDTQFDLSVTGNIKYLVNNIISENDLNTLISDLGENALIATKETKKGSVLITLGIDGEHYCLKIYDNGPNFDVNVIRSLGKSRYTTHALTGGSGIGLMTTFELLRKYNASFEIDECISHDIFTKCISVRFDSNSKLRIKSLRAEIAEVFNTKHKFITENIVNNDDYFETSINNTNSQ